MADATDALTGLDTLVTGGPGGEFRQLHVTTKSISFTKGADGNYTESSSSARAWQYRQRLCPESDDLRPTSPRLERHGSLHPKAIINSQTTYPTHAGRKQPMKIKIKTASNRGFTLIEVIVTMILVGIMAAVAGMGIVSATRAFIFAKEAAEISQKSQLAMNRITKSISNWITRIDEPCTQCLALTLDEK